MKVVLQRVKSAGVCIEGREERKIGNGLVILLGITHEDTTAQEEYLARKICNLRIFGDEEGKLNRSLLDVGGDMLIVSNFTLYGDSKKGNRPSFTGASRPQHAKPLYDSFIRSVKKNGVHHVETGEFGAEMEVSIVNDGPITLVLSTEDMMPKEG